MYCGFDIGGTKVLGLAVEGPDATEPTAWRRELIVYNGETLIELIESVVASLESDCGRAMSGIGIGVAGIVDRAGTLRYSPNIPGVVDLDIKARLEADLNRPVVVENDATAAIWAEMTVGAGRGSRHMALVALGTGIGTGFVFDGRLHRGFNGFAGESGHMIIQYDGPVHLTGAQGPWEYFASGSGLVRRARQVAASGELPQVVAEAGSVEAIDGDHVRAAIVAGDPVALSLLDELCCYVGIGVANLVHVLDPEMVIISGGVVDIGEPLIRGIQRWTNAHVLGGDHRPEVRVVAAQLGHRSGAFGAALLAARGRASSRAEVPTEDQSSSAQRRDRSTARNHRS